MALRRTIEVAEDGEMNLPVDFRRALGLTGAGHVVLLQDEDGIRLTMAEDVLRRVRELAAPYRQGRGSVVDEFIAERRAEAAREGAEE